jgi:hypothetical protein
MPSFCIIQNDDTNKLIYPLVGPLDTSVQKNTKMGKITAIFSLHTNLLYTINKSLELLVLIEYSMKNATIDFFTSN